MNEMPKRKPQVNFQTDEEFIEDLKVLAHRRRMTLSQYIRTILEEEMQREAERQFP